MGIILVGRRQIRVPSGEFFPQLKSGGGLMVGKGKNPGPGRVLYLWELI